MPEAVGAAQRHANDQREMAGVVRASLSSGAPSLRCHSGHNCLAPRPGARPNERGVTLSPDAAVSGGKDGARSKLSQKVGQFRNRPGVEPLYGRYNPAAQIGVGEGFAQPVELIDRSLPRQWVGQAALVAELLLELGPSAFRANSNAGAELVRVARCELRSARILARASSICASGA
jgi:hypothetical protein